MEARFPNPDGENTVPNFDKTDGPANPTGAFGAFVTRSSPEEKLSRVCRELSIKQIPIKDFQRQQLIDIVIWHLDAFAGFPKDLGRTAVVVHTIRTGDARPFSHALRTVPFAR